jgi:PBP1b-binding outer membrane lipoprotein LpoB
MKTPAAVFIVILALFLMSCSTTPEDVPPEVMYDYNVNYDFAKLKTYAWRPVPEALKGDQFVVERIISTVDTQMQAKGYRKVASAPDFRVALFGIALEKLDSWDYVFYEEGRLKLSFIENKTGELIWWGETRARLKPNSLPEEKDQRINAAVARILEKFPPSP